MQIQKISNQPSKTYNNPAFCAKGRILDEIGFPLIDKSGKKRVDLLMEIIERIGGKNDEVIIKLDQIKDIWSSGSVLKQQEAVIVSNIKARKGDFKTKSDIKCVSCVNPGPDEYFPKLIKYLEDIAEEFPAGKSIFERFIIRKSN